MRLWNWLLGLVVPRNVEDPKRLRQAELVARAWLITAAASVVMMVRYTTEGLPHMGAIALFHHGLMVASVLVLRIGGSPRWSAHLLCASLWLVFVTLCLLTGGIDSPNLAANAFLVLLAMLVCGWRGGLFWLGAIIVNIAAQLLLTRAGWTINTLSPASLHATALSEAIAACAASGMVALIYERGKHRMLHMVEVANADLHLILDNSGQGFASVDPDGRLVGERSAVLDQWFSSPPAGAPIWSLIEPTDPEIAGWLEVGWIQLAAGCLPPEVAIDQLPKRFECGDQTIDVAYRPLLAADGALEKVVVIFTDVSADVARERVDQQSRDLLAAFDNILADPRGFQAFVEAARNDLMAVAAGAGDLELRLHTLKGNAAVMGLSALAGLCDQAEDELAELGALRPGSVHDIAAELQAVCCRFASFLDGDTAVRITAEEHARFLERVGDRAPHRELAAHARSWTRERVRTHLARVADHASRLAERLGKGEVAVTVDCDELRASSRYDRFWRELVHVVRNAMSHGVESPDERRAAGKPPPTLALRAWPSSAGLVVEVADDGRGIDWDRVRAAAAARGWTPTASDPSGALFARGASTADQLTDVAGRGVGLSSVREVCDALSIRIDVDSEPGAGTAFRFTLPTAAGPVLETLRTRRVSA